MNKFIKNIPRVKPSHWLIVGIIVLCGIIAYHNCLYNEMFWDDDDFILKNRYIRDWAYFPKFFSENLIAGGYLLSNYWRPVLLTVFAWAYHTWEWWLPGWHALNIFFHTADGVLLYFLINRLFGNRIVAAATGILFVAHPVHNEAIVYVNSLGDPLATFFVLSSLLLFVRFRQSGKAAYASRNFYFSLLCFPLAVMSKETGFVLCGLLPMMDFLLLHQEPSFIARAKKTAQTVWPIIAMAIVYVILRGTVLNFLNSFNFYNENNAFTSNIFLRLMTFFKAVTQYTGFLLWPWPLRVEREMPWAQSLFEPDVLFGGAIVVAMVFAIFKCWKSKPWLSFGCCWFFIAIAPASNVLVPINAVLYEHFLYMPMIGIVTIASITGAVLVDKNRLHKPVLVAFALLLAVYCTINIRRNMDWHTAIGFYEQLVKYAPSYRVINNLGMEYADKGINDKAEIWYSKAIEMDPKNCVAYHNIAGTYRDTGRLELAEKYFLKAIELNPKFIFSYRSLAELYYRKGKYDVSLRYLHIVAQYDPTDVQTQQGIALVEETIRKQALAAQAAVTGGAAHP